MTNRNIRSVSSTVAGSPEPITSAGGVEWDVMDLPEGGEKPTAREANFVFETGIKFRVSLAESPLKFLTVLTDYWGIRIGVKSIGAFDINRLAFVVEIGAGAW